MDCYFYFISIHSFFFVNDDLWLDNLIRIFIVKSEQSKCKEKISEKVLPRYSAT